MPQKKVLLLFSWNDGDGCTYGPVETFMGVVSSLGQATGRLRKLVAGERDALWLPDKWLLKEAEVDGEAHTVHEWELKDLNRHGKESCGS